MQGPRRYRLLSPPRVPSSTLVARGVLRGSVSLIRRGDAMPIAAAAAALPDAAPRALVSILSHFASATSPATSRARAWQQVRYNRDSPHEYSCPRRRRRHAVPHVEPSQHRLAVDLSMFRVSYPADSCIYIRVVLLKSYL